jgi:MFS family permease
MALLISVSYLISLGLTGPTYLYAIYLKDTWGFSTVLIGWLLAIWGISGIVATRYAGRFADRQGPLRTAGFGVVASVTGFAVMTAAPVPALWAAAYAIAGAGAGAIYTAINSFPVRAFPTMRGGASSLFQSGKFFAPVTAPLLFNPLYFDVGTRSIFAMQAFGMAAVLIALWMIAQSGVLEGERRPAPVIASADPAD